MYLTLLVLPLFSGIISGLLGRKIGQKGNSIISSTSISLAALLSILAFYEIGINGSPIAFTLTN
jgi:NADH:ubiquinone oxidoreductase subunit 5 (subunit L)/multisubunit Na+/H+ antiporter MnhA subunit